MKKNRLKYIKRAFWFFLILNGVIAVIYIVTYFVMAYYAIETSNNIQKAFEDIERANSLVK
jgi:hypothetical protein